MIVIIMGVSGCGKSSAGKALAQSRNWDFQDADDWHPQANVEKMKSGMALDDADRAPWLDSLTGLLAQYKNSDKGLVLACSALKERYRQRLAQGAPFVLIHLSGSRELLAERLNQRSGHFMSATLLDSQLASLELPQNAITIDIALNPAEQLAIINNALDSLSVRHFN